MIRLEKENIVGIEPAIRGMRNPMNSWDKSDSYYRFHLNDKSDINDSEYDMLEYDYVIGEKDYKLMKNLCKSGTDHRKFMRMIIVYVDITAPLYWWKEFDTYKVGTVANSTSTMHKIHAKEFTIDDFSCEHLDDEEALYDWDNARLGLESMVARLNSYRDNYLSAKTKPMDNESEREKERKKYWWHMIQSLPSSYNQKRTVMLSYEVLANIYHARKNHKLDEWIKFCKWIESLPYSELITKCSNPITTYTLSEFVKQFTCPNTLIRLWVRNTDCGNVHAGHTMITENEKEVGMNWAILDGSGWQSKYSNCEVLGVTDIVCENYCEAVNIVIKN